MSTAPAPRDFDTFDDAFDVDMEFAAPIDEMAAARSPLQFTAPPAEPSPTAPPAPLAPVPAAPAYASEAAGFNPVGDVVAQAQASLVETGLAFTGLAPASNIGEVSVPRIAIHVFAERQDTLDRKSVV